MKATMHGITEYSLGRELVLFLLMVTAACAVYYKALSYGFLNTWDDPAYVVKNATAHGFSWEHIHAAFSRFYVGNYAPLHIISYMVDYTLWGMKPGGYIFGNIFLHACNGYLLAVLLRRFSLPVNCAILAAGLFILHPVQVESVVWISQRKNVLAMFFFLLSFYCYSTYRDSSGKAVRNWYLLTLIFFVCALLTKSVAVILPPMLLLYDVSICRRKITESIPDKLPFIFLAFSVAYIALLSQSHEYGGGGRTAFHGGSAWSTFLTMLPVLGIYVRMLIVPRDLSIVYAPQIRNTIDGEVICAFLILCLLAYVGRWLFHHNRIASFWYFSIPLAILPVAQIVPLVTLMNDRYLYFPMLGFASCVAIGARCFHDSVTVRWRWLPLIVSSVIVAGYGFAAFQRTHMWQNSIVLWGDATQKQPGSAVAWMVLGEVYGKNGDSARALTYTEKAKDICRGVECFHALEKLSTLYLKAGRYVEAEKSADELIGLFPDNANGYLLKGYLKYLQGDLVAAEKLFTDGIRIDPNQSSALNALGNIYLVTGRPALAVEKLHAALTFEPLSAEIYYSLACAESLLQQREMALNYLDQALRLGYNRQTEIMTSSALVDLRRDAAFNKLMRTYFP